MQVFIVGAGPGDPELITVKGQRLLKKADVIIYAGSLVNPAILNVAKAGAEIFNSASMTLPEVIEKIEEAVQNGKMRAHDFNKRSVYVFADLVGEKRAFKRRRITARTCPVHGLVDASGIQRSDCMFVRIERTVKLRIGGFAYVAVFVQHKGRPRRLT